MPPEPEKLVVSKQRVADHGEVYTPSWLVDDMLDLVKQETERIESRFLEPACGDGNFLAKVLERKLAIIQQRYRKSQSEFEKYSVVAVSSIYGIDIIEDNVVSCRKRLFDLFAEIYSSSFKDKIKQDCLLSVQKVFSLNIIHGDALSLQNCDSDPQPIVFAEWSLVNERQIKRRDFNFGELVSTAEYNSDSSMPLFSDQGEDVFIPNPVCEYPLQHYLKLHHAE
ncbi:MAG TPA: restriction endonuclease subunit M [Verrucomicrobiales bacterium]|nr:restriction endonuclease subunit M [Verrucomicrobiales bacterium]|tara:strand:+ start:164 stop:835 length:672 start_codon:yes stop_codon:yes gene_type:complete